LSARRGPVHHPLKQVSTTLTPSNLRARLGVVTSDSAAWVIDEAVRLNYISPNSQHETRVGIKPLREVRLATDGWKRHAELMRGGKGSRRAFMAMAFNEADIRAVYSNYMRPAVKHTDFDLRTTDEDHQTAGPITDRIRVEIRTSRFVVCDLTHGNRGAYWEAGFAEALGRPVFYTCRQDVLDDRTHVDHPHFDTAYQLILPWSLDDIEMAMQKLKAAIRKTLPDVAKLEDD
jgi:nucleoside 2-deoxyribosyltransferase